jgi:chloride channel 7
MRGNTFKIYPRPDTAYQSKASVDFQATNSNIYQRFYPRSKKIYLYQWLIFGIIGVFMGIIAFVIDVLVEKFVSLKWELTQSVLHKGSVASAWMVFLLTSVLFAGLAALLTIYIGPGAAGSGIAELMGYFNGIHVPKLIGIRTLVVKILGNALAVSASLCIGKEGPLAHIGAIVGHMVVYMPFSWVKYF